MSTREAAFACEASVAHPVLPTKGVATMKVRHRLSRANDPDGLQSMYAIEAVEDNVLAEFFREVAVEDGWQDLESLLVHTNGSRAIATEFCYILAVAGLVELSYTQVMDKKVNDLREAVEAWL